MDLMIKILEETTPCNISIGYCLMRAFLVEALRFDVTYCAKFFVTTKSFQY